MKYNLSEGINGARSVSVICDNVSSDSEKSSSDDVNLLNAQNELQCEINRINGRIDQLNADINRVNSDIWNTEVAKEDEIRRIEEEERRKKEEALRRIEEERKKKEEEKKNAELRILFEALNRNKR